MAEHTRRGVIGTAAVAVAGSLLARYAPALRAQPGDSRLEILVDEPIGTIAPEIYGHFVDKALTVTVVNPHATDARECAIAVRGAAIREGRATVLSSTDLRGHNSFEHPAALAPVDAPVRPTAGSLTHRFPAASVTRLQLTLA